MSGNRTRGVCVTGRNVTNYTNTDLSLFQNLKRWIRSPMFESQRVRCCNRDSGSSFDHTMVDTPHPIRTAKLSTIGPDQYCGGGPRGNLGCRMFFVLPRTNLFFLSKTLHAPTPTTIRSNHNGYTASHPNCEVKHCWAQSVLRWGTTRESWVLNVFFFICTNFFY